MMFVLIGGRHTIVGTIVVLLFFLLSLAFVVWFERDNRRRDSEQSDTRPPVFAAMDILQPAVLSFILICIALMIMMWLINTPSTSAQAIALRIRLSLCVF